MTSENELPGPYGGWESKLAQWGDKAGLRGVTRRWTAKAGPTEGWQGDRGLPCSGSQCLRQGLRRSPWQGLDKEHGPRETEDVLGGPGRLWREDSRGAGAETLTPSLPPTGGGRTIGLGLRKQAGQCISGT